MTRKIVSNHFTPRGAEKEAKRRNEIRSAASDQGRSSGWTRIDYTTGIDDTKILKKFAVVERTV